MSPKIDPNNVRIFSGRSHPKLALGITNYLGVPLEETLVRHFANDCLGVQLCASVRGRIVYIVQSLAPPVQENLMELLMMLDIARNAGASEVHAIVPSMPTPAPIKRMRHASPSPHALSPTC